jgi:hypothetical protein
MAKKKEKQQTVTASVPVPEISDHAEEVFRKILRSMSWMVGISFILIIILPNFRVDVLDLAVKLIFYFGIVNLILFALFESFANTIKKLIDKQRT